MIFFSNSYNMIRKERHEVIAAQRKGNTSFN